MHGPDPPAMMLEHALKRRRPVDIADQTNRGRVEIGGDGDPLFLGAAHDRLDRQIIVQRLAAAPVYIAYGGADLAIGVAVDLFLEEVDKSPIALKDRQNTQVGPGRSTLKKRLDPRREVGVGQGKPECTQC